MPFVLMIVRTDTPWDPGADFSFDTAREEINKGTPVAGILSSDEAGVRRFAGNIAGAMPCTPLSLAGTTNKRKANRKAGKPA